ncbi:hypothetical protein, partial [Acetobacterium sp. K1/6]|uniref:hypothetical protein n=1 Tax=Acetobacterium sp. K1/6 TaxID=3055467 RepID=UPI002ACA311C
IGSPSFYGFSLYDLSKSVQLSIAYPCSYGKSTKLWERKKLYKIYINLKRGLADVNSRPFEGVSKSH